jgi:hypothetical protein
MVQGGMRTRRDIYKLTASNAMSTPTVMSKNKVTRSAAQYVLSPSNTGIILRRPKLNATPSQCLIRKNWQQYATTSPENLESIGVQMQKRL